MPRVVLAFIILAVLMMVGVAGYEAALAEAGEDYIVTNESWTPDAGNVTGLDESNRTGVYYSDNATVYDENGNLTEYGTDYIWYSGNGTVKALAGGALENDSEATISYSYQVTTQAQRDMAALAGQVPRAMGFVLPIGALLFLLMLIRG